MSIKELLKNEEKVKEVAKVAFESTDTDKSGLIDKKELAKVMEGISKDLGISPPTSEQVDEVLKQLDTDKSGQIDFNEFLVLIKDVLNGLANSENN